MIEVGERLGRFELLREIGRGSHGVVFEANDTLLNERVAIKTLQPWLANDKTLRERFKRELILTRRVAHPGVCRLFDLHEEGENFFISMQFVEGKSLSSVLRDDAPSLLRVVRLLRGVCSALAAAHAQGVVHRDLKPANIMVDAKDGVVVLDFGIATAAGMGQLTQPGQALGSIPYIAPEVWEGQPATAKGDQYAVGVIGFAAATATLPYRGNNPLEVVDAIRAGAPTLRERRADVDPAYEAVILRAMSRDPAARYADIGALELALEALLLNAPSGQVAQGAVPQPVTTETPVVAPTLLSPPEGESRDNLDPLTVSSGVVDVTPFRPSDNEKTEVRVVHFATDMSARVSREGAAEADDEFQIPSRKPLIAATIGLGVLAVVLLLVLLGRSEGEAIDAGVAVAEADPVDSGVAVAVADVIDAGAVDADADAGLAIADLEPEELELDPEGADGGVLVRKRAVDPVARVQVEAAQRGVRSGDVAAFDEALARARGTTDKVAREKLAGEARKILANVVVDKAFVRRKLAYFNAAFDRAPKSTQERVAPLSKEIMTRFGSADWKGANAKLNRGFEALKR